VGALEVPLDLEEVACFLAFYETLVQAPFPRGVGVKPNHPQNSSIYMSSKNEPISIHWFRRDLRLTDNTSLNEALRRDRRVLCLFIFDSEILDPLPKDDARVTYIHDALIDIHDELREYDSSLLVRHGKPIDVWKSLIDEFGIASVDTNEDYEPYAIERDVEVAKLLEKNGIEFHTHTDHVIYKPGTVLKDDGDPYTVYTPFKNKWLAYAGEHGIPEPHRRSPANFVEIDAALPSLKEIGFERSSIDVPKFAPEYIDDYDKQRDDPAAQKTTYAGTHLRFGTLSIREAVEMARGRNETYLSELIWREFFIQILYHFPKVVNNNFRSKYDPLEWRNNEKEFKKWCEGKTGYPMVDAGMRQLNETGYMHNRVRMVVASFLCKHLLIDWRWGEAYFAEKLLDYELASNNGNWQWAAGTGCDAAPYFRVFNPTSQLKKFDPKHEYTRRWVSELDSFDYPEPMVEHKFARERALEAYKTALG